MSFSWSNNWQYLLLPQINVFGIVTNVLTACVFLDRRMEDVTFKYMLATTVNDIFYLLFTSWNINKYCTQCPLYSVYVTQIYLIYLNDWFTSSQALFNILIDIFISLHRYYILLNKTHLQMSSMKHYLVILVISIISMLYYLPLVFFKVLNLLCYPFIFSKHFSSPFILLNILKDIKVISNVTYVNNFTGKSETILKYAAVKNSLGSSEIGRITPIVLSVGRIFLGVVVLTGINCFNAYEFRKRFNQSNN